MATWWRSVSDDITTNPIEPFCITNRFWYTLRALLAAGNARNLERLESLDGTPVAITSTLANHWGNVLLHLDLDLWVQVREWDGKQFVPTRIAPLSEAATLLDSCELVELSQTPTASWIRDLAGRLATTKIALTIDGRAGRKYPVDALIDLTKPGERIDIIDLAKKGGNDSLTEVVAELGWDARKGEGEPFDLDASIVGCDKTGKSAGFQWFCYYNQQSIQHNDQIVIEHLLGDSQDGSDDGKAPGGPDEAVRINLAALPPELHSLEILVTIHKAQERGQSFARVNNAWVRLTDPKTGVTLLQYDLSERAGIDWNAMNFASIYRYEDGWKFKSNGDEGFTEGLQGFVRDYNIKKKA